MKLRALAALLNRRPQMRVVAEASDGAAAVDLFFQHQPDVARFATHRREIIFTAVLHPVESRGIRVAQVDHDRRE